MSNDIGELASRQQATQKILYENEREANEKIAKTQQRIKEAEIAEENKLDQIKDQYVKIRDTESIRSEAALESTKHKGYENIRDAQRSAQAELSKTRREGQADLDRTNDYFRTNLYQRNLEGEKSLEELKNKQFVQTEFERKKADTTADTLKHDYAQQVAQLQETQEKALSEINDAARMRYENTKTNTELATQTAQTQFEGNYERALDQQRKAISLENSRASEALEQLTSDNSRKLAAYGAREGDPFYQLVKIGAELTEKDDRYVLTAKIPPHEQRNLSVTVRGNQLVVSGQRRNQDQLEIEPGHSASSATYQSYTETFPLGFPVDAREIRRDFDGENVVIHIPKKTTYESKPYHHKEVERVRASRPQFPENLTISNEPSPNKAGKSLS